jgi:hypothetical protein
MQGSKVQVAKTGMPPPHLIFRGCRHEEDSDHHVELHYVEAIRLLLHACQQLVLLVKEMQIPRR